MLRLKLHATVILKDSNKLFKLTFCIDILNLYLLWVDKKNFLIGIIKLIVECYYFLIVIIAYLKSKSIWNIKLYEMFLKKIKLLFK